MTPYLQNLIFFFIVFTLIFLKNILYYQLWVNPPFIVNNSVMIAHHRIDELGPCSPDSPHGGRYVHFMFCLDFLQQQVQRQVHAARWGAVPAHVWRHKMSPVGLNVTLSDLHITTTGPFTVRSLVASFHSWSSAAGLGGRAWSAIQPLRDSNFTVWWPFVHWPSTCDETGNNYFYLHRVLVRLFEFNAYLFRNFFVMNMIIIHYKFQNKLIITTHFYFFF